MKISIKKVSDSVDVELKIVLLSSDELESQKEVDLLKRSGFEASEDELLALFERGVIFAGVGKWQDDSVRSACAAVAEYLKKSSYKSAALDLRDDSFVKAAAEGLVLGAYEFDRYKSKKRAPSLKQAYIRVDDKFDSAQKILKEAIRVSKAVNFTREIVNTPPDDFYPASMVKLAKKLAKKNSLRIRVLKSKEIKKEKMNALLAVSRASRHKPRVIQLSYIPKSAKAKVTLVGKGLTYDSGGLSLKPSEHMVSMKADKSGASTVVGILKAVSELALPVEVHGFLGMVENMIGGDAYKPDDVLRAKNGTTIEVKNTDAEGRLVLADVLTFAQQEVDSDYIFDYATLTGACVVGLGNYTTGVMGESAELKEFAVKNGAKSGELLNALEFNKHLKKRLKSEVADICNISNTRYGGALTAGIFLSNFIDEKNTHKWLHFDIAGPAYVEHRWGENPYGASGAGVRMSIEILKSICK